MFLSTNFFNILATALWLFKSPESVKSPGIITKSTLLSWIIFWTATSKISALKLSSFMSFTPYLRYIGLLILPSVSKTCGSEMTANFVLG